jgi:glycosyltransferase involved in cell wall biosynthesis
MTFQDFIEKYQKVPVEEYPNNVLEKVPVPILSCRVSTYQHAPYIRQCLDGIIMQKTNFPFEIVIGEDESSDDTREICIEYAKKYPDIIRLFLHKRENNILINGKSTAIFQGTYTMFKLRGKYQAICEGDDYWTDPLKIQKQVDFLDKNYDYGLVYTNYIKLTNNKFELIKYKTFSGNVFDKLIMTNFIGTLTVCFRKNLLDEVDGLKIYDQNFKMGDYPLWLAFASITKFKFFTDSTSVYRISPNTLSNQLNIIDRFNFEDSVYDIRYFFLNKIVVKKNIKRKVENSYLHFLIINNIRYTSIIKNRHFKPSIYFIIKYLLFYIIIFFTRSKSAIIISKI